MFYHLCIWFVVTILINTLNIFKMYTLTNLCCVRGTITLNKLHDMQNYNTK